MTMGAITYAQYGSKGTWYDDAVNFGRGAFGGLDPTERSELRNRYAWAYIRYTCIPESVYRYTRLYLAALICRLAQQCGRRDWVRAWQKRVNAEAITIASRSLESTILQIGWIHPRTGLALHAVQRLATRTLHMANRSVTYLWGFPRVEKGYASPINGYCFAMAIRGRAHRIYHYLKTSLLAYQSFRSKDNSLKAKLHEAVEHVTYLVKVKLDIPRHELGMVVPLIGHTHLSKGIDKVRELGAREIRKLI